MAQSKRLETVLMTLPLALFVAASAYPGTLAPLIATASWTAGITQSPVAYFGTSVSTAGDINGDGYDDVIVGSVFVHHGSPSGLLALPGFSDEGNQTSARLGWDAGPAGDVNGDGASEIIVAGRAPTRSSSITARRACT